MQASVTFKLLLADIVFLILLCSLTCLARDSNQPPHEDLAKTARYIVHKADWCTMTTISSNATIVGRAFSEPTSVSDGPLTNSTGIPYLYHSLLSYVVHDIQKNTKVTLSFSEAQFGLNDCLIGTDSDPEWPLCARLTIMGNMQILNDPTDIATAKNALFSRHPAMSSWSAAHPFVFMKLDITNIMMIDYFGGWKTISTKDYFNVKQ